MIIAITGPHKVVLIIRVTMRMRTGDHQSVKLDIQGDCQVVPIIIRAMMMAMNLKMA